MKRILLLLAVLMISFAGYSQNYACLQDSAKHYFTNSNSYLRGIRIDSVRTYIDSTVFYPFRTTRGQYNTFGGGSDLNGNGGSWLGKKVVSLNDGTFMFDNIWNDTVIIKTQANVGESWIFYTDTSNIQYRAEVTSIATQTIYGVVDSVKTILISAIDNTTGLVLSDPVDELKISLSKSYGFYEVFDIYLFPHRRVNPNPGISMYYDTIDYFFQECGSQQFKMTEVYIPRKNEIDDFAVGDIYEFKEYCLGPSMCEQYVQFRYVGKEAINATETKYTVQIWKSKTSGFPTTNTKSYSIESYIVNANLFSFLHPSLMPEETGVDRVYSYNPGDNSNCFLSHAYGITIGRLFNEFEPCGHIFGYKLGFGKIYESHCYEPIPGHSTLSRLIFSYKNGVRCGTHVPISVDDVPNIQKSIAVYPNPASDEINVSSNFGGSYRLSLTNLLGQVIYATQSDKDLATISTKDIPAGMCVVCVADENGNRFNQKISIVH